MLAGVSRPRAKRQQILICFARSVESVGFAHSVESVELQVSFRAGRVTRRVRYTLPIAFLSLRDVVAQHSILRKSNFSMCSQVLNLKRGVRSSIGQHYSTKRDRESLPKSPTM